ncbi:hypothetical protein EON65_42805, partial [archaeon]
MMKNTQDYAHFARIKSDRSKFFWQRRLLCPRLFSLLPPDYETPNSASKTHKFRVITLKSLGRRLPRQAIYKHDSHMQSHLKTQSLIMKKEHSLLIIGAGWGRTGTTSLKAALEQLGYPCYHMLECVDRDHSDFWNDIANGKIKDFDKVFREDDVQFTATMDFPASLFWREILQRYPEAKVILTIRDPESWYKSYKSTILTVLPSSRQLQFVMKIGYMMCFPNQSFISMLHSVFEIKAFQGSLHKENIINCYKAHNEAVIKDCP